MRRDERLRLRSTLRRRPGELFITMAKVGSTIGGLVDMIGTQASFLLQYRVPLEEIINKLAHTRFEPSGFTKDADVPLATSVVDYVFRWLGTRFVPGYREQRAQERPQAAPGATETVGEAGGPALTAERAPGEALKANEQNGPAQARRQTGSPACDFCGALMVRAGSCYWCAQCGSSSGCG